jgi:H+/Cl- antiporter ClcA
MLDPFFWIAALGAPIAVMFLIVEARRNATAVPSVATCFVALFAAYGVYVWLFTLGFALFGQGFDDEQLRGLQGAVGLLAGLIVGVPFLVSARRRQHRASTDQ